MPVYLVINYTDYHDVDEDLRTLLEQGGRWTNGGMAGITRREMYESSTNTLDIVASVCQHSRIIRMRIMSTKT